MLCLRASAMAFALKAASLYDRYTIPFDYAGRLPYDIVAGLEFTLQLDAGKHMNCQYNQSRSAKCDVARV